MNAGGGNHDGDGTAPEGRRPVVYCVIPRALAPQLHELLRRHFSRDPAVQVVVDQRSAERRRQKDRRLGEGEPPRGEDRRKIRSLTGRRIADRRATEIEVDPLPLPRRARSHAALISFTERLEPTSEQLEDRDTARLVTRFQSGDRDVFKEIYLRYFDRVYGYMRVALRDAHEAEDQTQQVFAQVFEFLDTYERRSQPFRAWLFATARNSAIRHLRRQRRLELHADEESIVQEEPAQDQWEGAAVVGWITDPDLMLFVERLPLAQRQVLALRFMLGMDTEEIARILDRSPEAVRQQLSRALRFLEKRLAAVGRTPRRGGRQRAPARLAMRPMRVLRERRFGLVSPGPV
jgi:RNA polymerase sigma-70 factor (ECF subfamily)